MKNGFRWLLILSWLIMGGLTALLFMLALGSERYGGLDGLALRMQTELNQYRPRPQFVPTPLPIATVNPADFAGRLEVVQAVSDMPGPTPTLTPTTSQVITPTAVVDPFDPTPTAGLALQPVAPAVELTGYHHAWQTWNNCGPATISTNLSYYGLAMDQAEAAAVLKPNRDDKNVNPAELVAFARSYGFNAQALVNGNEHRLRQLLSNGIPVLVETWLEEKPNDGLGHYRLLVGYDDATQQWIASDSFISTGVSPDGPYRGIRVPYQELDPHWAVFNRLHVLIYPPAKTPIVEAIVGAEMDAGVMWDNALQRFQAEIQTRPDDPFVWFNLGSTLTTLERYEAAAAAFDQARQIGLPWRMLWYQFGPFKAYYEAGRYAELISLADATIATGGEIEEVYYWQGLALLALDDPTAAQEAWQHALELKPTYTEAQAALNALAARLN